MQIQEFLAAITYRIESISHLGGDDFITPQVSQGGQMPLHPQMSPMANAPPGMAPPGFVQAAQPWQVCKCSKLALPLRRVNPRSFYARVNPRS